MSKSQSKNVGDDWTWFADYGGAVSNWTVNCPASRNCEVGMGIMLFGKPRGEKIPFQGVKEFSTIGIGAIHVRVLDGKGSCPVRLDEGSVGLINLPDIPFP